jgi:coenzyme PQQ synthesis protein D (PqqD)
MYKVSEGIRSTHGQDGAIVLDIRQGQMFNLNFVGSRILKLLKDGSPQPEIVNEIVREFGVSRHLAENDVQQFLRTLEKSRLVESTNQS